MKNPTRTPSITATHIAATLIWRAGANGALYQSAKAPHTPKPIATSANAEIDTARRKRRASSISQAPLRHTCGCARRCDDVEHFQSVELAIGHSLQCLIHVTARFDITLHSAADSCRPLDDAGDRDVLAEKLDARRGGIFARGRRSPIPLRLMPKASVSFVVREWSFRAFPNRNSGRSRSLACRRPSITR